ncbi:sensor histidine kinase [Polaromonas sp.]|uniref:sensor histidine kinase n=1 Tax=Polaromonas sp. TaxID=1869339 RepID=UPI0035625ACC
MSKAAALVTIDGVATQQDVILPYHWDRLHPGKAGAASFVIEFERPATLADAYAVYIPRLGNAYEVWLNGNLLAKNGSLTQPNGSDYAKVPRLIPIAADQLEDRNQFRINVRTDIGRRGGLAALILGPDEEIRRIYNNDYAWRATGTLVVMVLSFVVGLVALALWLTQTTPDAKRGFTRDPLYLLGGLAELFWTLRISDALIEEPPLMWPWWGVVTALALGGWLSCMGSFFILVAGWAERKAAIWFNRVTWGLLILGIPLAMWALGFSEPRVLTAWYGLYAVPYVAFVAVFCWQAARRAAASHRVVAAALIVNMAVGLRDWFVFRISPSYADNTLLRYSSVLFGLALAYIVISRFREVSAQARDLMINLSARVAEKERELNQSYRQVEQLAREQERVSERTRILRDMHDGVGAHLSTAIRQLQSGKATTDDVLQTLRYTLDQLKLSIDAMHLPPGDIASLLANLRYRLEPRFAASDIELQWVVGALEPVPHVDANAMRQIQFMVFEALSNVLQHSHATTLAIEAEMDGAGIRLRIVDNGRGFDAALPPRKGLLSMRERATAIGVAVSITSQPGRTVVEIRIP